MTAEVATLSRQPTLRSTRDTQRGRSTRRAQARHASRDAGDVYRALGPAVYGYLQGRRVDDPENLLGEVFLHVTRSLPGFEGDDDELRRWVFAIARNRVIDHRRRVARRPTEVAEGVATDEQGVIDQLATDDDLIEAIGDLTDDQREVIALRFIADLPLDVVADMTGRTVGAVKAMQHRALHRLSNALRIQGDDLDQ